ncbi:MAG: hypothetical protein RLZZ453_511 [Chlamydiota bacterium]|jgi:chromosome segregation ATPase
MNHVQKVTPLIQYIERISPDPSFAKLIYSHPFFEKALLSNYTFFPIASTTFSYLASLGYLVTCIVVLQGEIILSLVICMLSSTTLLGSYLASYCELQQSFETSATELKEQNHRLKNEVNRLEKTNTDLKKTACHLKSEVKELSAQVKQFAHQNQEMKGHLKEFGRHNATYEQLLDRHREEGEYLLAKNRQQTELYESLIQTFAHQLDASGKLWETVRADAKEDREHQEKLISTFFKNNEEKLQAIYKQIQTATEELKTLNELKERLSEEIECLKSVRQGLQESEQTIRDLLSQIKKQI